MPSFSFNREKYVDLMCQCQLSQQSKYICKRVASSFASDIVAGGEQHYNFVKD